MKFYISLLFIFTILCTTTGCTKRPRKVDLDFRNVTVFSFDTMNIGEADSVFIFHPYYSYDAIEELGLENLHRLKAELKANLLNDGHCTLLFTQKHKIISYSTVKQFDTDFSYIKEKGTPGFSIQQAFFLDPTGKVRLKQ